MSDSSDEEINAGPTLDERAFEDQKRVRQAKTETIGETDDEVSDQAGTSQVMHLIVAF